MATTPSYNFNLPTIGGDTNTWGELLNDNWSLVDELLDGTETVDGIDIDGGAIDGTPIGATTPSTGAFTDLASEGTVSVKDPGTLELDGANGRIALGKDTPTVTLDISATDAIQLPVGTTAQRPGSPAEGMVRRNSTTKQFEGYNGIGWVQLDAGADFANVDGDLVPDADDTHDIGTSLAGFADAWFKGAIHVDNFAPSAGGTAFGIEGIAKASLRYEQDATPTIIASVNVSSVTDDNTGQWRTNFSNAFDAADYNMSGSCERSGGTARNNNLIASNTTASVADHSLVSVSDGNTVVDDLSLSVYHGDLA